MSLFFTSVYFCSVWCILHLTSWQSGLLILKTVARDFTCQGSDSQGDLLNTQKILYQIDENGDDANRKTEAKTYIIIH